MRTIEDEDEDEEDDIAQERDIEDSEEGTRRRGSGTENGKR
jgi:hypothetical protein